MRNLDEQFIVKEDGTIERIQGTTSSNIKKPNKPKKNKAWIFLLVVICIAAGIYIYQGAIEQPELAELKQIEERESSGMINNHNYVNLGLSVKWATCNIGTNLSFEYGDYFAWGELSTKEDFRIDNSATTGRNISDISGNPEYDVARMLWGNSWRIPTEAEWFELLHKCKWEETSRNGVNGYLVIGPNGNSIFLPAAGWRDEDSIVRTGGFYWSSTPDRSDAAKAFLCHMKLMGTWSRCDGLRIRPVSD